MVKRNLNLEHTPLGVALTTYLAKVEPHVHIKAEVLATDAALDRVTAAASYAPFSSPAYNVAAMDGIAVEAARTVAASADAPLRLQIGSDYQVVNTGNPIAAPFDAVIMIENVVELGDSFADASAPAAAAAPTPADASAPAPAAAVEITAAVKPWANVRPIGEDFQQGEMLLPSYHIMRPMDIGLLLSSGLTELAVIVRPSVAVIPTGTELIEPDANGGKVAPKPGAIIDSNSRMIAALVKESGGLPDRLSIVADDYESLKTTISQAVATHDIVLINAGSSAGTEDYTASILRELGEVVIHGVAVKPGKPVILALVDGTPVIGLPGYPLATFFDFNTFAGPVMALFTGIPKANRIRTKAVLIRDIASSTKFRQHVQVNVGLIGERLIAIPLSRGSGVISSLVRADGFIIVEQELANLAAGTQVEVNLYRDPYELAHTVLAVGSHDPALDIIADLMPHTQSHTHLAAVSTSSRAGLEAIGRGEAHITPCRIYDEHTDSYNVVAIQELLDDEPMALIKGFQIAGEDYDFAIPQAFLALEHIVAFIKVLTSPELHTRLKQRGGYGFAHTGEIVLIEERDKSKPFGFCHY